MTKITATEKIPNCIQEFISYFENLKGQQVNDLSNFYAQSIKFEDPIHHINSIELLTKYFEKLNQNLKSGGFQFKSVRLVENTCYLEWIMNIELKRPNKKVSASGISVVSFDDKITHHRDYFDAGELFYENIPVVGSLVRYVKKKIAK